MTDDRERTRQEDLIVTGAVSLLTWIALAMALALAVQIAGCAKPLPPAKPMTMDELEAVMCRMAVTLDRPDLCTRKP
jgi:hypothetical protein